LLAESPDVAKQRKATSKMMECLLRAQSALNKGARDAQLPVSCSQGGGRAHHVEKAKYGGFATTLAIKRFQ